MPETTTTTTPHEQETVAAFINRSAPIIRQLDPELRAQVDAAITLGGPEGFTKLGEVGPIFERLILLATAQQVAPAQVLADVKAVLP